MNKMYICLLVLLGCTSSGFASDTYTPFLFQDYAGTHGARLVYLKDEISFDAPDTHPAPRSKHP